MFAVLLTLMHLLLDFACGQPILYHFDNLQTCMLYIRVAYRPGGKVEYTSVAA